MDEIQKFNARFPAKVYAQIQKAVKRRQAEPGGMKFSTNDWVVEAARRMLGGVSLPEAVMAGGERPGPTVAEVISGVVMPAMERAGLHPEDEEIFEQEPAEKGTAVLATPVAAAANALVVGDPKKRAVKQPIGGGPKPIPEDFYTWSNSARQAWLRQNPR